MQGPSTQILKTRDNGFVAYIPAALANTVKLHADVNRAAKALTRDVVHVYYELGFDWIGNPSIFFKVVLTDQASRPGKLSDVAQRVALKLMNEVKTDQKGVHAVAQREFNEVREFQEFLRCSLNRGSGRKLVVCIKRLCRVVALRIALGSSVPHSYLKAIIGSTRVARLAGI